MRSLTALVFVLAGLIAQAQAAAGQSQSPPGNDDPFARFLFPPDRVMSHSLEIGLQDAQKTAIKNEVQKVQGKFLDTQFELQAESEKMVKLLQAPSIDEAKVLAQVDHILALEKEIKKTQVSLLVRIRNILTPEQRAKLAEIPKVGEK